jgi:hypothetical protein
MARYGLNRDARVRGEVWDEDTFQYLLTLEQRRSKRSRNAFALAFLNATNPMEARQNVVPLALPAVSSSIRETDLVGWFEKPRVLGVIFTHVGPVRRIPVMMTLRTKLETALQEKLGREMAAQITISLQVVPEDPREQAAAWHPAGNLTLLRRHGDSASCE